MEQSESFGSLTSLSQHYGWALIWQQYSNIPLAHGLKMFLSLLVHRWHLSSKPLKLQNCCYTATNTNSSYTTSLFNKSKQTHKYYGLLMQYYSIKKSHFMQCGVIMYCVKSLRRDHNSGQDCSVQIWNSLQSKCWNSADAIRKLSLLCPTLQIFHTAESLTDVNHIFRILYTQVS